MRESDEGRGARGRTFRLWLCSKIDLSVRARVADVRSINFLPSER
jgi:hypothetical protein